jgi:DNA repair photolyase
MALKQQTGNMYEFVTHMWGPVRGKCPHDCSYCYVKRWGPLPPMHIDERDMKTDLCKGNFIFVGHTVDLFAEEVPKEWIERVLIHCCKYPDNKYLFQSKNPMRFLNFLDLLPTDVLLATTIETNRVIYNESKAPPYTLRAYALKVLSELGYRTMVTIEPIFDFDLEDLVGLIKMAHPEWVNIGADSKGHRLPEPSREKINQLIDALKKETSVKLKGNLQRLMR